MIVLLAIEDQDVIVIKMRGVAQLDLSLPIETLSFELFENRKTNRIVEVGALKDNEEVVEDGHSHIFQRLIPKSILS